MNTHDDTELSTLVKKQAPYFEAPASLHSRLSAALQDAERAPAQAKTKRWATWQTGWGLAVGFAFGVLLGVAVVFFHGMPRQQDQVLTQVIDEHVRSLMGAHLADVASSDQHTVKPWFSGKLDFSPPVHDLAEQGFPLLGGRLDYINEKTVAALVYKHRLHTINVFIWPATSDANKTLTTATHKGINVKAWQDSGMQFWAVSDVGMGDLEKLGVLLREREKQ